MFLLSALPLNCQAFWLSLRENVFDYNIKCKTFGHAKYRSVFAQQFLELEQTLIMKYEITHLTAGLFYDLIHTTCI